MLQALTAYAIVALAAAWVVWSMFLPRSLKLKLRPRRAPGRLPPPVPRTRR